MLAFLALIVFGLIIMASFIKIVSEGYRGLVVRLRRYSRTLEPGVNFLTPF